MVRNDDYTWESHIVNADYENRAGFKENERIALTLSKATERGSKNKSINTSTA